MEERKIAQPTGNRDDGEKSSISRKMEEIRDFTTSDRLLNAAIVLGAGSLAITKLLTIDHDYWQVSGGDGSMDVSSSSDEVSVRANWSVTRRLTEISVEDMDTDLLLQRSGREEGVVQWLRALDLQVTGACRANERLKPLFKLNASAAMAEDGLLAHLSQHFELSEVGMLARCLWAPLVSVRVGKINKQ